MLRVLRANVGILFLSLLAAVVGGGLVFIFLTHWAPDWVTFKQSGVFKSVSALTAVVTAMAGAFGVGKWATDHAQAGMGQAGNILWTEAEQRAINRYVVLAPKRGAFERWCDWAERINKTFSQEE